MQRFVLIAKRLHHERYLQGVKACRNALQVCQLANYLKSIGVKAWQRCDHLHAHGPRAARCHGKSRPAVFEVLHVPFDYTQSSACLACPRN